MKSDPLLVAPAVLYGAAGLALVFAPAEILASLGGPATSVGAWLAQLLGSALLGLAWLNWLQRSAKVGGIFGRHVLLPNLMFTTVAFWLTLSAWRHQPERLSVLVVGVVFGTLSVLFGIRMFGRAPSGT